MQNTNEKSKLLLCSRHAGNKSYLWSIIAIYQKNTIAYSIGRHESYATIWRVMQDYLRYVHTFIGKINRIQRKHVYDVVVKVRKVIAL